MSVRESMVVPSTNYTSFKERIEMSKLTKSIEVFNLIAPLYGSRERRNLALAILLNTFLSILDMFGVALIGLVGALAVRGVQTSASGSRLEGVLEYLNLDNATIQFSVAVLGLVAAFSFLCKTAMSAIVTKKVLSFLSRKSADISHILATRVIGANIQVVERMPQQEVTYALTTGAVSLTVGVMGGAITLISDLILVFLLLLLLIVLSPNVAIPITVIFVLTGLMLNRLMHKKALKLGLERWNLVVKSNTGILDALLVQRTIYTSNLSSHFRNKIFQARLSVSRNIAETEFMPYTTKYVIEVVLVVFSFLLAATQFFTQDATKAVASLLLFMAAGMRIAPAVMRMQQASIQVVGSLSNSNSSLEILKNLNPPQMVAPVETRAKSDRESKVVIECMNLSFKYEGNTWPTLKSINLSVESGRLLAIVGPSGSGKSTLADVLLGVLNPTNGRVLINGLSPEALVRLRPNDVGYVPQKTHLLSDTVLANVFMAEKIDLDLSLFWSIMEILDLKSFISALPRGAQTVIGDGGIRLSGGQAQRIGIARALIKQPKVVILDEATSALDAQVEEQISKAISMMRNQGVCVVIIAHRLSTVRNADEIVYLEDGKIEARGNFETVRQKIPNFNEQARLMGL
jgi:ABC-type multidrug transport system fused ATPase/permease subunit